MTFVVITTEWQCWHCTVLWALVLLYHTVLWAQVLLYHTVLWALVLLYHTVLWALVLLYHTVLWALVLLFHTVMWALVLLYHTVLWALVLLYHTVLWALVLLYHTFLFPLTFCYFPIEHLPALYDIVSELCRSNVQDWDWRGSVFETWLWVISWFSTVSVGRWWVSKGKHMQVTIYQQYVQTACTPAVCTRAVQKENELI